MPYRVSEKTGGELFIVDNSEYEWKVVRYLHDWCDLSKQIDIATGYFEIGSLLSLDGEWQKVDKIRILMGDEVSIRTKKAFEEALANIADILDKSLEKEKEKNPFLTGVSAIVDAIKSKKIECRIYRKDKFHAKAYITHARKDVIGSSALVGSSNFTYPGLHENIELNVQITGVQVGVLQEWYEEHWKNGEDVSLEMLKVVEKHSKDYSPFEVYARALRELFEHHTPTEKEWEQHHSVMYKKLDQYQKEGYHSLLKISSQNKGAFLCDGVGLGKTFVGMMLLERLIMCDKKRVVLIVPKSGRVPVWEAHIKRYLPNLLNGFLPFKIYNHTDLTRGISPDGRDFPAELEQIKEQADVVIIDEAHHFRNRGLGNTESGLIRSRYWKLYDILSQKTLFLLTATPVNNSLTDFQHQIELFSRSENKDYFAKSLGINHLPAYFQNLEKAMKRMVAGKEHGEIFVADQADAQKVLFEDRLFRTLVVQRSRAYATQSQLQAGASQTVFPEKQPPQVAEYSIKKTYGSLLGKVEVAFSRPEQLFNLTVYYPLSKWIGKEKVKEFDENRQKQVVRLIRIQFLKRFESSICAFESSCQNLLLKLLAFLKKNAETKKEIKQLEDWRENNDDILKDISKHKSELNEEVDSEEVNTSDLSDEYLDDFEKIDRNNYKIEEIFTETYDDLDQLAIFIKEINKFSPAEDNKLKKLVDLLKKDKILSKHKVIIFTEFMATARYLKRELIKEGIEGVEEIDSSSYVDRTDAIKRFAPYYNETSSSELVKNKMKEIRVLISTDILSEGLNLQDSTRLINYDLHWNPVRLMQRIGRVDRRLNPEIEAKIVADHPEQKDLRGKVLYWNFLPPEDLDTLLKLYNRVSSKTLRISKVFGIEGKKLLHPKDDYEALKDFNHEYEGSMTSIEEMHLEYQKLLLDNPDLKEKLEKQPKCIFSGKTNYETGIKAMFFCYVLPAQDKSTEIENISDDILWTENAGRTEWYMISLADGKIMEGSEKIIKYIRCNSDTSRNVSFSEKEQKEARSKVEKHITNTIFKQLQAPQGVRPILKCWEELK